MSARMDAKHGTPTVLARLMGLDELPYQQPVEKQKRQRVLSDNYLRKVASIGVWEKHSSNENSGYIGFSNSVSSNVSGHGNTEACPHGPGYPFMVPKLKSNFEPCPSWRKIAVSKQKPRKAKNPACFLALSTSLDESHFCDRKRKGLHSHQITSFSLGHQVSGFKGVDNHAKEPGMMMFSSKNFPNMKSCYRSSICYSGRSYMAGEVKKRISKRWRMTKEFRDGLDSSARGRSRTLAEMLAMSDCNSKPEHFDDKQRLGSRICSNDKHMNFHSPFGIGSQDVWKDESARGLPTSRLIFTSPIASLKTRTGHKTFHDNVRMTGTSRFAINWESQKSIKQAKDCSKTRKSGFGCIESQCFPYLESKNNHLIDGKYAIQNQLKNSVEENNPSGLNSVVSKLPKHNVIYSSNHATQEARLMLKDQKNNTKDEDLSARNNASRSMASDTVADAERMVVSKSAMNHKKQHLEPTDCIFLVNDDSSSTCLPETLSQQEDEVIEFTEEGSVSSHYSNIDQDSLVNSEAAYQPSPVSVLQTFDDEISSGSEFFKSINAGLHGVRLQLEILKSNSLEADSEGAGLIVSSDDDSEEESLRGSDENEDPVRLCSVEESRDFSYMVDVLTVAGFHSRNHMNFEGWHSPECPIRPTVFETLEKKYGKEASWKRSERRLLFDRINLDLAEIFQTCPGVPMQAKPLISFRQRLEVTEEELWSLLVNQEKEASKESQKLLGNDDGWLVLGNDIEVISREIEDSLIDELAAEVVDQES